MAEMCEKKDMEITPNYQQGHLVVAAARILEHANEKPPTMEEIGVLLHISHEVVGVVARALESHGIVKIHKTPFDTRVEVADHTLLEDLPREDTGAAMREELVEFQQRSEEKQAEIDKLFSDGEYQKKQQEKHVGLDKQLKEWQQKRAINPFDGTASTDADEGEDDGGDEEEK